jgi:formylmethanofuran dehydrogenase subunit E
MKLERRDTQAFMVLSPFHEIAPFCFKGVRMENLQRNLEKSAQNHTHLCPRQILGVRIGMAGLLNLKLQADQPGKRILVILESDGCFADGVIAATGCTIGHRTLRVEDYGKVAATFIDTELGRAIRISPVLNIRKKAFNFLPEEPRHYFAQMQAYQQMSDEKMFNIKEVTLSVPIAALMSRPGRKAICDLCGEEILNEREIHLNGLTICRPCGSTGYCSQSPERVFSIQFDQFEKTIR